MPVDILAASPVFMPIDVDISPNVAAKSSAVPFAKPILSNVVSDHFLTVFALSSNATSTLFSDSFVSEAALKA